MKMREFDFKIKRNTLDKIYNYLILNTTMTFFFTFI